jgi:hypothetical protein
MDHSGYICVMPQSLPKRLTQQTASGSRLINGIQYSRSNTAVNKIFNRENSDKGRDTERIK